MFQTAILSDCLVYGLKKKYWKAEPYTHSYTVYTYTRRFSSTLVPSPSPSNILSLSKIKTNASVIIFIACILLGGGAHPWQVGGGVTNIWCLCIVSPPLPLVMIQHVIVNVFSCFCTLLYVQTYYVPTLALGIIRIIYLLCNMYVQLYIVLTNTKMHLPSYVPIYIWIHAKFVQHFFTELLTKVRCSKNFWRKICLDKEMSYSTKRSLSNIRYIPNYRCIITERIWIRTG